MRKTILCLMFAIIFLSFASAETTIIFNDDLNSIYNYGDIISLPITVKTTSDTYGTFQMSLLCGGTETEFYKNGVGLVAGEEKKMDPSLVLMKSLIANSKGTCKIKASMGSVYETSKEFKISDKLTIELSSADIEFMPEEEILIEGHAIKENQKPVNGFIELSIVQNNSDNKTYQSTINNGYFSIDFSLPKDTKAGQYLVKLNAYEKDILGEKTNTGFTNYNIYISQVPTSLEIVFDNSEIEPGDNAKMKAVLYDQTGEMIENTTAKITIRDKEDKLLDQEELQTNEFLEFPTQQNQPPAEFKVSAVSNGIETESSFSINEKKDISVELINRTLEIINTGNVVYCNKSVLIKIGTESSEEQTPLSVDVCLGVNQSQKYQLTAPDGDYLVEIISDEGTKFSGSAALTGKVIDIEEAKGTFNKLKYWFVWIFIIAILGCTAFFVFRKTHKKKFFAYMPSFKNLSFKKVREEKIPIQKNSITKSKNRAELLLSIKGEKQNSTVICLKIKNLKEIISSKSNSEEIMQEIVDLAEDEKASTYENGHNLFFILAPVKTKTFKNERSAVKISQRIKTKLDEYNRIAKQKIDFGISLNYGPIIAKQDKNVLKFMSVGTLISAGKKIAEISNKEILLSQHINDRLKADVKTEKHMKDKIPVYTIKEIKDKQKHEKFLRSFLSNLDKK